MTRLPHFDPTIWKARRRAGLPLMTKLMYDILYTLAHEKQFGVLFIDLSHVHGRTIQAMTLERDWIVAEAPDSPRYTITARGEKALKVYSAPARRFDGLCPRCGVEPRYVNDDGLQYAYCYECNLKRGRRQYAMKGYQLDPAKPCSRCKKRKRHTYPSGKTIAYCLKCKNALSRKEKKRRRARLLERILGGEVICCSKCDQPVYYTKRTVYDLCYAHYREYQNRYQAAYLPKWKAKQKGKAA